MTGITWPDSIWRPWPGGYEVRDVDLTDYSDPLKRGVVVRAPNGRVCWGSYFIAESMVTYPPTLAEKIDAFVTGLLLSGSGPNHPGFRAPPHRRRAVDYGRTLAARAG